MDFDPARELKINVALNNIFYGLMNLEIMGIRVGMNYPVGGSRLIIATRKLMKKQNIAFRSTGLI